MENVNPLFESRYTITKDLLKTLMWYNLFGHVIAKISIVWFCLAVIYGFVALFYFNSVVFPVIIWTMVAMACIFVIVTQLSNLTLTIKRQREVNGGADPEVVCSITENSVFYSVSTGNSVELKYSQFKKVVFTKKYILLISKNNLCFALKTDSFTGLQLKQLEDFFKEKGFKTN